MKESIRSIINDDAKQIVLLINGNLSASLPPQAAKQLAKVLLSQAALIENNENPNKQIIDQAILMRAGLNIGLSSNKKVLSEASKEAQWNRDLRRYMKADAQSITSKEIFGLPTIKAI